MYAIIATGIKIPICNKVLVLYFPSSNNPIGTDMKKPITKMDNNNKMKNTILLGLIFISFYLER